MSSCASHLHSCSSHASEHFPRCPFCNPTLPHAPTHPFVSFRERVLNVLGMARGLPSGLGIGPVDCLSSFVPFGGRLILQRLTGYPQRPLWGCSPTPLPNSPITHISQFHALRHRITIVWAKTTPNLDTPTSFYLYICNPLRVSRS